MNYHETKKMDEFVTRLFEASDLLEALNPKHPLPWKKGMLELWGKLEDLGNSMMNDIEWDAQYLDDKEAETF